MLSALLLAVQAAGPPAIAHYQIAASIGPALDNLVAHAVLTVPRSAFGAADSIHLALGGPAFQRLRLSESPLLGGRPTPFRISPDSSELVVPLGTGDTIVVSMAYRLTIDTTRRRQLGYDLFSATEKDNSWYPTLLAVPDSIARFKDFEVDLELPPGLAILTSGAAVDSAAGAATVHHRYRVEHIEGFALALARGYVVRSRVGGDVVVRALSPGADTLIWDRVASETVKAADWYRTTYGFFPVREIGIVPGSTGSRGGFPLPNMFMIHQGDLSPGFVHWITAHELAHYYWGLYVLSSGERLDWLMLGFGIWTDSWYLARSGNIPLEAQWRSPSGDNSFQRFAEASIADHDLRLGLPEAEAEALPYDYNSEIRHAKGSIALYLLSLRMGPERFVELQRVLLADFKYRPLSTEAFARRIEAAGIRGAGDFLRAWSRADAGLGFAVRGVRAEPGSPRAYWIQVARTGTIPWPVTIEVRPITGPAVRARLAGEAESDSVRVVLGAALDRVEIDPDGVLPMGSSANLDMRRVYLRAMGAAGPVEPFLVLARKHLTTDPDPAIAALMVEQLFELGRFGEIRLMARQHPFVTRCGDRMTCLAALQVARSLARTGGAVEASVLLRRLDREMTALGFGTARRLRQARTEIR